MRLEWSLCALQDRDGIFDYIVDDNPAAAIDVDERIGSCVQRLIDFPESGRPGRVQGTRELVISQIPYVVAFCIEGDTVRVLRVLHGALLWPDSMTGE